MTKIFQLHPLAKIVRYSARVHGSKADIIATSSAKMQICKKKKHNKDSTQTKDQKPNATE